MELTIKAKILAKYRVSTVKFKAYNLWLALIFLTVNAIAQSNPVDTILAHLNNQHPRLEVASLKEFESIKANAEKDPYLKQCKVNVLKDASQIIGQPVCTYEIPDGLRLLEMSRKVLNRCYVLSMAYRLTGDKKYSQRLWLDLLAASQFPDWNSRHFLDVAEMTHAFAIGYDWLYDVWSSNQKQVIKQAIMDKGLGRGLLYYEKLVPVNKMTTDFPRSESNWNSVCNSGMAIGALAIADEEPKLAAVILRNALGSIPLALKAYAPDGGFREGPSYWTYAMKYNVALMASLQSALGTDFGLGNYKGLSLTGNFPIVMRGATGMPYQYADAWPNVVNPPLYFWLAKRYDNSIYLDYIKSVSDKSVLDMVWYNTVTKKQELPLDNFFANSNVGSFRSGWNDPNAWYVGIKGGNNRDPHAHLDLGSFIMERNNVRWLVDLGVDSYQLPGYFDEKVQRWTYYRTRAEGHNTLVIDPGTGPDQDIKAKAPVVKFESRQDGSIALLELTDPYHDKLSRAMRGIALINKSKVLVQDEITAINPVEIYSFFHTTANINIAPDGKSAVLKVGDKKLFARIIAPANATFGIMPAKLLPTSIPSIGNDENAGVRKLFIHLEKVKQTTIAVIFTDVPDNSAGEVIALNKW